MNNTTLYSIGYGNRRMEDFIELIKTYHIEYLVDVRSIPYSKINPIFNRDELYKLLSDHGIQYVFMGDTLGGRPKDLSCYDKGGKVDYIEVKKKDFFKEGIARLINAESKGIRIVIMCSERNPTQCHRSKLIGAALFDDELKKICIQHIDEYGKLKDQATVMNELNKGRNSKDLFDYSAATTSNKSYIGNNES